MLMQIPKRKSAYQRAEHEDAVVYLSKEGMEKLERQIRNLKERDEPQAIHDVSIAVQKGDLSENAEYQEARSRLTRIQNRVVALEERKKRVIIIDPKNSDCIEIGSRVTVESDGKEREFEIVGPQESDPARGRISYLSPIGSTLLKRKTGDTVTIDIAGKEKAYTVVSVA